MSCTKDGGLFGKGSVKAKIVEEYMDGSNALYWGRSARLSDFSTVRSANEKYRLSSGADSRNGKFKSDGGNDGATISGTVAVSPYYEGSTVTMTDGVATIRTVVPSTIHFSKAGVYDAGVCPLVAVTDKKKSDNLSFVAPLGGVSVKLTGEVVISKVEITAKGGEIINGDMMVTADNEGVIYVQMSGGSSTTVIDCDGGIQLTQVAEGFRGVPALRQLR